jgi:hypothetical protein
MKLFITVLACWVAATCQAQIMDTASQTAASYFKEAAEASQGQQVWRERIYGPMLFVDPQSRVTYGNMPDSAGLLKPVGGIYKGILPMEVIIANTSIFWQGRRWSVILWPLPGDHDSRLELLMHESFHRIQEKLGLPERSPTVDHLSSMYGRIYFLLELQALKAALNKPVSQRSIDLTNALIFRARRQELFPGTFPNERLLEMHEGLAQYTGVILGRQADSIRQYLTYQIDSVAQRRSLIRSSAYFTGPAYGYLLYEKYPGWTAQVDSNSDFPLLISKYYQVSLPQHQTGQALSMLEKKYNGDAIIRSEKVKEGIRLQTAKEYTDLFTRKPVLTITLVKMGIGFNPSILFDLGGYGTVYPTAEVKDTWGQVNVTAPGMLMKDWKIITLPAEDISVNGRTLEGRGWKLVLNDHWELFKADPLHYRLVHKD